MNEPGFAPLQAALQAGFEHFALVADAIPQLVWVARSDGRVEYYNRRWTAFTGLSAQETNASYGSSKGAVHPDDLATLWERWTNALATGAPYEAEYRLREAATGLYRWFVARATPIRDERGAVVRWIGTCTDIDEQQRARRSLTLLTAASDALFESFDLRKTFAHLCELVAVEIGDSALVLLAEGEDVLRVLACAHRDPQRNALLARLRGERVLTPDAERAETKRLREQRPRLIKNLDLAAGRGQLWPYLAAALAPLEPRSSVTIPLCSRTNAYGGLYVFYGGGTRAYDERDVPLLCEVARRASIAIENARSFERERRIAETFQRVALPTSLAQTPDLHLDAVFVPGSDEAEIGGDWYDSVVLHDGSLLVDVGDVLGRGLDAASVMARVRQIIRVAGLYEEDPSRILDAADHLIRQEFAGIVITAFCGIIDPSRSTLRYANAGHRSPFLRRGGSLEELRSTGLPLGIRYAAAAETQTTTLPGAELLVLYTDGLVEVRDPDVDGERRLAEVLESGAIMHASDPAAFIRDGCHREKRADDIAILTVRFRELEGWSFSAENAQAANDARADFVRYLRRRIGDESATAGAELVFGELVGNVVRHARGGIDVHLDWRGESPTLHVIDRGGPFASPGELPENPLAEGGRGLFIARSLSERIAIERVPGYGNHVWAALKISRPG